MAKSVHHACLFNYNDHTYIFECKKPHRLRVPDILNLLSDDLVSDGFTREIVSNLEVFIDDDLVFTLELFSPGAQSIGRAGASR